MSNPLQPGQYYGKSMQKLNCSGVVMSELLHTTGKKLPMHTHEAAYFSLLLSGAYSEQFAGAAVDYRPFTIGFHPPHLTHRDEVGPRGVAFFTIDLPHPVYRSMASHFPGADFVPDLHGSEMTWLAVKLYRLFKTGTADSVDVEALTLEMMAQVAKLRHTRETGKPGWLRRAVDLLHSEFTSPLTLQHIAHEAGVHPVHLSRVFRRTYRQTMGEYVNNLRVQFAAEKLHTDVPLVQLSIDAGFADQSHCCRVFKMNTGTTPGDFRKLLRIQSKNRSHEQASLNKSAEISKEKAPCLSPHFSLDLLS